MYSTNLECTDCGKKYALEQTYECPECKGILTVNYDYKKLRTSDNLRNTLKASQSSMWAYKDLLPINNQDSIISLGEGQTPLINMLNLKKKYNIKEIYLKDETRNPFVSFKDRPTSVGVSKAIELGFDIVTVASSGNASASLASYAARAKLKSIIFIPENTPISKVNQALTCGAKIIKVKGNYSSSYKIAAEASKEFNWANITSTYLNPYTFEGDKTIAFELYNQLNHDVPDYIFVPVGSGPLLYGIYKGYKELKNLGLIDELPSMICVQAEGCSPIVKAFQQNKKSVLSWDKIDTIALGIADPLTGYEKDGTKTLECVIESNGLAVAVSDREIENSVLELACEEGIFAEPAAATSWAGYKKLLQKNIIDEEESTVLLNTGHGLKQSLNSVINKKVLTIQPNLNSLNQNLDL